MRRRTIKGSVVVVVGATSGVGRATALSLAADGADLVLVARTEAHVSQVAHECRELGARVVEAPGDISRVGDIDGVVSKALAAFGRIDTWINLAAALVVGELDQQPPDDIARIITNNVLGTTLASRAAMAQFHRQGSGVLINVSSLLGIVPNPVVPTYAMTKFAVRGLSLCLAASIRRPSRIRVCLVMPGPIDSPMFQRAANYSGKAVRAIPPAASPERVAATVIRSVVRPRRQRTVGFVGALVAVGHRFVPRFTEYCVARVSAALVLTREPASPTSGSLYENDVRSRASGGWRRSESRAALGDAFGRLLARRMPSVNAGEGRHRLN